MSGSLPLLHRNVSAAVAIFVARRDVLDRRQQRLVGRPAGHVLAERQGRQRVAVVAAAPCDEEAALGLAALKMTRDRSTRMED